MKTMFAKGFASLSLIAVAGLAGCSSSEPVETVQSVDTAEAADTEVQLTPDSNCLLTAEFLAMETKTRVPGGTSYDRWQFWEEELWQELDATQTTTFDALMEAREMVYSLDRLAPPELGTVFQIQDDGSKFGSPDPRIVRIEGWSDSRKATTASGVEEVCSNIAASEWIDPLN